MCFENYRLRKTWLVNCLKNPVSQHSRTVNMWNPNSVEISKTENFFITPRGLKLEKVSLSDIWKLKTVFQHIDRWWYVFSL